MSAPGALVVGESGERLAEMLALVDQSDSVELKLTVPEYDQRSTAVALGMDPLEAQIRQVVFFDTPDLALDKAGVVVRARRSRARATTRWSSCARSSPPSCPTSSGGPASFGVEVDAMPGASCAPATMKGMAAPPRCARAPRRAAAAQALLEGAARVLAAHAPEGIGLDDLSVLGPIFVLKLKVMPGSSTAGSSPRCGSTPTARASSSSHEVPRPTGVPGRRRAARLPRRARHRHGRRAADQDPEGARVLRRARSGAARAGMAARWEWRTFGDCSGAADAPFAALDRGAGRRERRAVPALHRGRCVGQGPGRRCLDVKRLRGVDGDGLEQWEPVLKAGFPLSGPDLATVCAALRVGVPDRAPETLDGLVGGVGVRWRRCAPWPCTSAAPATRVGGCQAELSEVRTDGDSTRTIAVESEDPALVAAAVQSLGLAARTNTCMARGLKTLAAFGSPVRRARRRHELGQAPRRRAACRRHLDDDRRPRRRDAARRGPRCRRPAQQPEPMREPWRRSPSSRRRPGGWRRRARSGRHRRDARRAERRGARVRRRGALRRPHRDDPGRGGGRLGYLAAKSVPGRARGLARRVRHRRRQLAVHVRSRRRGEEQFSVPVGAARLHRALRARRAGVRPEALAAALRGRSPASWHARRPALARGARRHGRRRDQPRRGQPCARPSTTPTSCRAPPSTGPRSTGSSSSTAPAPREQRRAVVGLQPNRAEVILAGACVVRTVLAKLGCDALVVSDRGVRHGLIADRVAGSRRGERSVRCPSLCHAGRTPKLLAGAQRLTDRSCYCLHELVPDTSLLATGAGDS